MTGSFEWLRAEVQSRREDQLAVVSAYEGMSRAAVRSVLLVELKCRREHVLLHVWRSPEGLRYYQPPYKNSPNMNAATSTAEGREANTVDGDRRWRSRGGSLPHDGSLELSCDHVKETVRIEAVHQMAAAARPGTPTRRIL